MTFFYFANKFSMPYIRCLPKFVVSFSFTMNCVLLYIFLLDVHDSLTSTSASPTSLIYLWRIVWWTNFSLGFVIFPIVGQTEHNFEGVSSVTLLYQHHRRKWIIIAAIVAPILTIGVLVFDIPLMILFSVQTLKVLPIFIVLMWGFMLLNLHLSLALNHIPKFLMRKISFSKQLSKS
jgi:hypothetical protein